MIRAGSAWLSAALVFVPAVVPWACPPASAITAPVVDPAAPPPSGAAGPVQPMEQRGPCITSGVIPGSDPTAVSASQAALNLGPAWQFSRGEGQLVAVLDSGVRPGPRLPNVDPGGDFVENSDGLTDCDGHGTLVAGIVAGQPSADDGFSGVAPAARVLAVRTASARFSPRTPGGDPLVARVSLQVATLGRAIVRAADLGARVIDISEATCVPADRPVDQAALGAAIRYAAVDKDAVLVAAAGNLGSVGSLGGGMSCEANPLTDLGNPADARNWAGVTSVSTPSWWQPYVLSVGSLTADGQPSRFTMSGPWVGIGAPGEKIVSVSNRDGGGLANGLPNEHQQLDTVGGTGYAAGYVAGVAALVRSKYRAMSATDVIRRITATAHNGARAPSNLVGAGSVDALAALTWELPTRSGPVATPAKPVAVPPAPAPKDTTPRTVAFVGTAALAVLVAAAGAASAIAARRRKETTP
ncbi:type VII secretion-associated serine protease mycosin [Mycobacterium sherrisii]|uniref:Type VII secretion-associated serine protease mycosin n=1 Tax=Mycobacterium sherrisii TaxID=243061 RepID=A0A1E3SRB5_9MYCO|nr:type VII secretion-associated serine protease mycosin [Mycobacterium sherrisii]MCV7028406.1 type VII secretion-associated serine protease mycosin [Mycobacterium sherrisii]MEC4764122.1 type VII secretion-associated serine protease mycosin [Mycobacterium sherrisii]ODR04690.1 type VII secretion-associated serine protease mycosin [Mycobacterium sherrisii]ORW76187.1 subtilase [Mycobacterium sherrisii]